MRDFSLFDQAIRYAIAHPAEFDMDQWVKETPCGTTHCIGGHMAVLSGREVTSRFTPASNAVYVDGTFIGTWATEQIGGFVEGHPMESTPWYLGNLEEVVAWRE